MPVFPAAEWGEKPHEKVTVMPPCQSGGISQIRHAPPPGLSPFPKPKREVCINARSAWAVRFFFAHGHWNGRAIILQPNDKYVVLSIDRREGFAGPSRHIHIMWKLSPKAYRARQCPKGYSFRFTPPHGHRPLRCSAENPGPFPTKQQQAQRVHAAPVCYFFPVTSSSPDCAASHRPPRPPATRRILPGK